MKIRTQRNFSKIDFAKLQNKMKKTFKIRALCTKQARKPAQKAVSKEENSPVNTCQLQQIS